LEGTFAPHDVSEDYLRGILRIPMKVIRIPN